MDSNFQPRLRPLDIQWIEQSGQPALLLQDRLAIGARGVVVPQALVPLLALCDGKRDLAALRIAYQLETGIPLRPGVVETVFAQLDEALMLESDRFAAAYRQALDSYRSLPSRSPALAGNGYPAKAPKLADLLDSFMAEAASRRNGHIDPPGHLRAVICPHIDYARGGLVYARLWDRVKEALAEFDLFLVLGTDHAGAPGALTLTRQSYDTPFGVLPTDEGAVDMVAEAMGPQAAFGLELNHRTEHSVELAAVWLRYLTGNRPVKMVPVLCGSFHPYTEGNGRPAEVESWRAGAEALISIAQRELTLVVAAADLAHMGPSFGDSQTMGPAEQASLSLSDAEMLATICRGDAEGFLDLLVAERDSRKVCGLPPIYLMLKLLSGVVGETVAYSIRPAPGESVVSVTGVILSASGKP